MNSLRISQGLFVRNPERPAPPLWCGLSFHKLFIRNFNEFLKDFLLKSFRKESCRSGRDPWGGGAGWGLALDLDETLGGGGGRGRGAQHICAPRRTRQVQWR